MNKVILFIRLNKLLITRFLVSGGVAALVNLLVLYVLTEWFGWWYLVSAMLSFISAVIAGFILQKLWTFKQAIGVETKRQFVVYLVWTGLCFFLNLGILFFLVDVIGVYYILSQMLTSGLLAVGSWFVYSQLIFKL